MFKKKISFVLIFLQSYLLLGTEAISTKGVEEFQTQTAQTEKVSGHLNQTDSVGRSKLSGL